MIRLLAISLLVTTALPLSAQTPTHLYESESIETKIEFVQNLRRKGYPALAKEFTEQLIKTAKQEDPRLTLEQARTAVALAKEKPPAQRMKLLAEARALFEPFLKSNPNSPAGAQARLEMARLYSMQAQLRLNRAYAEEDPDLRAKGAKEARDLYDAANDAFEAAIKVLQETNQKNEEVLAEFDRALNFVAKASAYIESNQNRDRALTVHNGTLIFAKFAKDQESATGLLANAYLLKCYQEEQYPDKVNEQIEIVEKAKGPSAIPAQRLAVYYHILYDKERPGFKGDPAKSIIDRANLWFQRFPTAKKSFEGEHLRYEQAVSYWTFAYRKTDGFKKEKYDKMKLNTKDKAEFETNLNNADKIAKELAAENGDFSERGTGLHNQIERIRILLEPTKSLASFDAALLTATTKFREADAAKEADAPKIFREGQALLRIAIAIGEKEGVQPGKMHEAQFLLGRTYLSVNDLRRSAISFDALARSTPPSKKGAEAAAQAIRLYKDFAEKENDERARDLLFDLGDFVLRPEMQRLWDGDPVIGVVRYNLAMDLYSREKHKEALDHLEKMPKDSLGYAYAQSLAVFIALAGRENADTPDKRKPWTAAAKAALARIGPLPAAADGTTTLLWLSASLKGPEFLREDAFELLRDNKVQEASACYDGMAKMIAGIEGVFVKEGGKLADKNKERLGFTIEVLKKYAHLGAADIQYRIGNYAKVLEDHMLGGLVKEVLKLGAGNPNGDIPVADVRVVGESLNLVLRAFIQLGQLDQAKNAYGLLMRIKATGSEAHDSAVFTRALIKDLSDQVEDMKTKKETKLLKVMVGKFTIFGDALAKSLVYDSKNPDLRDVKNLALFFSSLEQFKKAADLFDKVPKPKFLDQPGLKATDAQEKELYTYWDCQLEFGNLLRKSKDNLGANKVYISIINHPNGRLQTYAKKEKIHIYEEMEYYGTAQVEWSKFMKSLQPHLTNNKNVQSLYFDAYYSNAICFYKFSQLPKSIKEGKSELNLNNAATLITQLEAANSEGWQLVGPRFIAIMEKEKKLKDAYEAVKNKRK